MRMMDGIPVLNATRDIDLNVDPVHILDGVPYDPERCAGALACLANHPEFLKARFYKSRAFILQKVNNTEELVWLRYSVPRKMLVLEAINDVAAKDIEQAKKYAGPIVLKAPSGSAIATGRQQGSDKESSEDKPKRILSPIPMRGNAPTQDT